MKQLLTILSFSCFFYTIRAIQTCSAIVQDKPALADFLFLLDASGSMCSKIAGVASGLTKFIAQIQTSQIQARYALMYFGGKPNLRSAFQVNITIRIVIIHG